MTALNEFDKDVWDQSSVHVIIAKVMARPDAATFKFDASMVETSKVLLDWAEYVVDHYVGNFELMISFRTQSRLGKQLSYRQLAVALNTLLNCWRRSLKETKVQINVPVEIADMPVDFNAQPKARAYPTTADLREQEHNGADLRKAAWEERGTETKPISFKVQIERRPHDGTYTFVDANGDYRVLRFQTTKAGDTYVAYQFGPDNTSNFAKTGKIDAKGDLIVWGTAFHKGEKCIDHTPAQRADLLGAIVFICSFDKDAQLKAGEAYALKSGNCFICGRELTVPSSISAGIGPVCASKWGTE